MAGYIYYAYRQERLGAAHSAAYDRAVAMEEVDRALVPPSNPEGRLSVALLLFVVGLALIVGGGSFLVNAAIAIAEQLNVSDAVIGLTIVAVGTSVPELVTSAVAALRKQGDIALGNVLGSNIYNILFIGGITGVIAPTEVPASILGFDLWVLVAVSILVMVFAFSGRRLSRVEGMLLVATYAVYSAHTAGLF
jgi:cation:H+ antiporter